MSSPELPEQQLRFLVVEDSPSDLVSLQRLLGKLGYEDRQINHHENLADCLSETQASSYDLIFLDFSLPDANGYESIPRLGKRFPDSAIVLMTGEFDKDKELGCLRLGAQDYITKGHFSVNLLERVINYSIERFRMNQQLIEAHEQELIAKLAKKNFLATMSHELRSPLNVSIGLIEFLAETSLDSSQREVLRKISAANFRLNSSLESLLSLTEIERGEFKFEDGVFHLKDCLSSMVNRYSLLAEEKRVEFTFEVGEDVCCEVVADSLKITQMLSNVLDNAIKFTRQGKIHLKVTSRRASRLLDEFVFEIEDSGCGISENQKKDIFRGFYQAEQGLERRFGGLGLGLTLSRAIAVHYGGRIEVESKVDFGSMFRIVTRLATCEQTAEASAGSCQASKTLGSVLVVDDDEENRLLVSSLLGNQPFSLDVVDSGRGAVELIKQRKFDVVLMDIQMPEMNGYEAACEIARLPNGESVSIVGFSANAFQEDIVKARDSGFAGYLTKPASKDKLLRGLRMCSSDSFFKL